MQQSTLEPAFEKDAELLAAIHEECFPTYWDREAFTDFFSVAGTLALISCGTQSVSAGSCAIDIDPVQPQSGSQDKMGMMVWRNQHEQSDIITLAVRPAFRRRSLAKAMLEAALAQMRSSGVRDIFLDVEDGNLAAIKLYEAYGFTHQRRRKLYYRQKDGSYTDALVMRKKLA